MNIQTGGLVPLWRVAGGLAVLVFSVFLGLSMAKAVPTSKPKVVVVQGAAGEQCRKISTAGVDHGKDVAQKYADDLLAEDVKSFRAEHGIKSWTVKRRFRVCKYHLWFFGDEYNCTSGLVACWPRAGTQQSPPPQ